MMDAILNWWSCEVTGPTGRTFAVYSPPDTSDEDATDWCEGIGGRNLGRVLMTMPYDETLSMDANLAAADEVVDVLNGDKKVH